MTKSLTKKEKFGRATAWVGLASVANGVFLSICSFVFSMWEYPFRFLTYLEIKSNLIFDTIAYIFLILGTISCILSLFTVAKKKPVKIGLVVAVTLSGFHFLSYFAPPDPEGLELEQLTETRRFIRYAQADNKSEFEMIEERLIQENTADAGKPDTDTSN